MFIILKKSKYFFHCNIAILLYCLKNQCNLNSNKDCCCTIKYFLVELSSAFPMFCQHEWVGRYHLVTTVHRSANPTLSVVLEDFPLGSNKVGCQDSVDIMVKVQWAVELSELKVSELHCSSIALARAW